VFLAVVFGSSGHARLKDSGEFFCLFCKADRRYSLREWRRTSHFFFIPLGSTGGEFVLCSTCQSAFDPECLDESSTKELDELEVDVPGFACGKLRPRSYGLSKQLGYDPRTVGAAPPQTTDLPQTGPPASAPSEPGQSTRVRGRQVSAYSAFRKH